MNPRSFVAPLAAAAALVLAACSSGSHGTSAVPRIPAKTTPVQVSIIIPVPAKTSSSSARRPQFVSPGTVSGAIGSTIGRGGVFDLSASSPNCSTSGSARTCTVPVDLPIGQDQITMTTYDGPLATGHQLATVTVNQTIVEGKLNTVVMSLQGIPATATIVPATTKITALGTPVIVPLTVSVYDASGNQITGTDPYAITGTAPYTARVVLAMSPVDLGLAGIFGFTVNGNSTPVVSAPSDQVSLYYPGMTGTATAYTIVVTSLIPPNPGIVFGRSAQITVVPGFTLKQQIGSGPMTNAGVVQRSDSLDTWITEPTAHKLAMLSSSGTFVEYPVPSGKEPRQITYTGLPNSGAPLFVAEFPDTIGRVALNGTITETTVPTPNPGIGGIAWDGAHSVLYFAESAGKIGTMDLAGNVAEYPTGIAGSTPASVAVTPNNGAGGVMFTDPGTNSIGFMDAAHGVTEMPIPTGNGRPSAIAADPVTGDIWFAESNAAKIGHSVGHSFVEYPAPDVIVSLVEGDATRTERSGAAVWALTRGGVVLRYDDNGNYTAFPDTRTGNGTPAVMAQGYSHYLLILRSGAAVSDLDAMFY